MEVIKEENKTTVDDKKLAEQQNAKFVCQTPGCGKAATLECPTCQKLSLPASHFCGQECFTKFWPIHKLMHQKPTEKKEDYAYTGPLRPGKVSPKLFVPEHIKKPDYAFSGQPHEELANRPKKIIEVKSEEEIQASREACLIGRKALDLGHSMVKPGVTTDEIDRAVHEYIIQQNAYPSPLNYFNYPKSICTSINEIVCHGIPDDRPLQEGDIVNLDISVYYKGQHADLNETYCVGKAADSSKFLIEQTYRSLEKAIAMCKPGTMYKDIGNVIAKHCEGEGLSVCRTYCGHGVGRMFHCAPDIPHYANNKTPGFMKAGHIFTIEPMINQGTWKDVLWNDGWTCTTLDGQRSAQFEHTILVTPDGCEVLTKRLPESPPLDFVI